MLLSAMPRRNPAPPRSRKPADFWISAISFATKSRQVASALREAKGSNATLDELCDIAASVLERSPQSIRGDTLAYVASYVQRQFMDARLAQVWVFDRDRRLSVWTGCQCVRWAIAQLPRQRKKSEGAKALAATRASIQTTEAWVLGQASINDVRAFGFAAKRGTELALWAAAATEHAAQAASYSAQAADPEELQADFAARTAAIRSASAVARTIATYPTPEFTEAILDARCRLVLVIAEAIRTYPG